MPAKKFSELNEDCRVAIEQRAGFLEAAARRLREEFPRKVGGFLQEVDGGVWVEFYELHAALFIQEGKEIPPALAKNYECEGKEFDGDWYRGFTIPY